MIYDSENLRDIAKRIKETNSLSLLGTQTMLFAMADILEKMDDKNHTATDVSSSKEQSDRMLKRLCIRDFDFPHYEEDWTGNDKHRCLQLIKDGRIQLLDLGMYGFYTKDMNFGLLKHIIEVESCDIKVPSNILESSSESKVQHIVYDIRNKKAYTYIDDV